MRCILQPRAGASTCSGLQAGRLLLLLPAPLHHLLLAAAAQSELLQRVALRRAGRVPAALAPSILARSGSSGSRCDCTDGAAGRWGGIRNSMVSTLDGCRGLLLPGQSLLNTRVAQEQMPSSKLWQQAVIPSHLLPAAACAPPAERWDASPCIAPPAGEPCSMDSAAAGYNVNGATPTARVRAMRCTLLCNIFLA